ncbi:enoyl-CoA hydratase/isomerase family protein [Oceanobacillus sp. CAU 1775]
MSVLEVKIENKIAYITMNRPDKRNALSIELANKLVAALEEADQDKDVRAVILAGAGKGFSAGGDIETMEGFNETSDIVKYMKMAMKVVQTIRKMDTYVIAAVQGFAAGAGFSLALAADFVVAEKDAKFVSSFTNIALIPDLGLIKALSEKVPINIVKEWISAAKPVDAEEAARWGIVNRVASENLLEEATDFAQFIIDGPPLTNQFVKHLVNHADQLNYDTADLQEIGMQTILLQSQDNKEGIAAFFEKRRPNFTGN